MWKSWKNLIFFVAAGILAVGIVLWLVNRDRQEVDVDPREPDVEVESPINFLDNPFGSSVYAAIRKDSTTYEQVEIEVPDNIDPDQFENVTSVSTPDSTIAVTGLDIQSTWFPGFSLRPPQTVSVTNLQSGDSIQVANVTQSLSVLSVDLNSFGATLLTDLNTFSTVEIGLNYLPLRVWAFHVGATGSYRPMDQSFHLRYNTSIRVRERLMLTVAKEGLNLKLSGVTAGITYKIN